jgi:demethylmenaquinone methyltransferase/2-methoxy-6-polyprenyl-1,4-benzoquinol methylase
MTTAEKPVWTQEGEEKRAAVQRMFAQIAPVYDRMNGLMSLSLHHQWRKAAVAWVAPKPGERCLDVCTGTGDFLPLLRAAVGDGAVLGVDFCGPMLKRSVGKADATLALGDANRLPVQDATVDVVTVGWGIRNVPDIDLAHREIFRSLRSGGRFVSLDTATPQNPVLRCISTLAFRLIIPALGAIFGRQSAYAYLPESTLRFWSRDRLAASMREAGFADVGYRDLYFGNLCLHFGRKP